MVTQPFYRFFIFTLFTTLIVLPKISFGYTPEELDQEIKSIHPSHLYSADQVTGNNLKDLIGNKNAKISKVDDSVNISQHIVPSENPAHAPSSSKEIDLSHKLYLDFNAIDMKNIKSGFTWMFWLRGGDKETTNPAISVFQKNPQGEVKSYLRITHRQVTNCSYRSFCRPFPATPENPEPSLPERDFAHEWLLNSSEYAVDPSEFPYIPSSYFPNGYPLIYSWKYTESRTETGTELFIIKYDGDRLNVLVNGVSIYNKKHDLSYFESSKHFYVGRDSDRNTSGVKFQKAALYDRPLSLSEINQITSIVNPEYGRIVSEALSLADASIANRDYRFLVDASQEDLNDPNVSVVGLSAILKSKLLKKCGVNYVKLYSKEHPVNLVKVYNQTMAKECLRLNEAGVQDSLIPKTPDPKADDFHSIELTHGEMKVDESGQFNYTVPLTLPAGTAGVTPKLSLAYSSQGGLGLAGWGWNISGLSTISRCGSDMLRDGKQRGVMLDDEDHYCLDGQRLVEIRNNVFISENYNFSEFHKTSNGFAVKTKGYDTWYFGAINEEQNIYSGDYRIKAKNGVTTAWYLQGLKDQFGNYIRYEYSMDHANGEYYITQIAYGGKDEAYPKSSNQIKFNYQNRAKRIRGYRYGKQVSLTKVLTSIDVQKDNIPFRFYEIRHDSQRHDMSIVKYIRECISEGHECRLPLRFDMTDDGPQEFKSSPEKVFGLDHQNYNYHFVDIDGDTVTDLIEVPKKDNQMMYVRFLGFPIKRVAISEVYRPSAIQIIDHDSDGVSDIMFIKKTYRDTYYWHTAQFRAKKTSNCGPILFNKKTYDSCEENDDAPELFIKKQMMAKNLHQGWKIGVSDINGDAAPDLILTNKKNISAIRFINGFMEPWGINISDLSDDDNLKEIRSLISSSVDFNGDGINDILLNVETIQDERFEENHAVYNTDIPPYVPTKYNTKFKTVLLISDSVSTSGTTHIRRTVAGIDKSTKVSIVDLNSDGLSDLIYATEIDDGYITAYNGIYYQINLGDKFSKLRPINQFRPKGEHQNKTAHQWMSGSADTFSLNAITTVDLDDDGKNEVIISRSEEHWPDDLPESNDRDPSELAIDIAKIEIDDSDNIVFTDIQRVFRETSAWQSTQINTAIRQASKNSDIFLSSTNGLYVLKRDPSKKSPGNLITKITKGYSASGKFNLVTKIDYLKSTWDFDYKRREIFDGDLVATDFASPKGPMSLVKKVTTIKEQDGLKAEDYVKYEFQGKLYHRHGAGDLGFTTIKTKHKRSPFTTTTQYSHDVYTAGLPLKTIVYDARTKKIVKESANEYQIVFPVEGQKKSFFAYPKEVIEVSNTIGSNGDSINVSRLKTIQVQDKYGNVTEKFVVVQDKDGNDVHITSTFNTYGSDETSKKMGRLTDSIVQKELKERVLFGVQQVGQKMEKSSRFTYYESLPHKGMLHQEIIEEGTPQELMITHFYDDFGNEIKTTKKTKDGERTSAYTYSQNGRYLETETNTLGEVTHYMYNGQPASQVKGPIFSKSVISPSKLVTTEFFSNYGNVIKTLYPDGTENRTDKSLCKSVCPEGAVLKVVETHTGKADKNSYFDRFGRKVREETVLLDGSISSKKWEYDLDNRVTKFYEPSKGEHTVFVQKWYDDFDRVTYERHSSGLYKEYSYYGLITVASTIGLENDHQLYQQKGNNELGQEIIAFEIGDNSSSGFDLGLIKSRPRVEKQYDVYGKLTHSTTFAHNQSGELLSSALLHTYDKFGRKIKTSDPEKGIWQYEYDAFGQLIKQTDSNGDIKTITYDKVGRTLSTRIPSPNTLQVIGRGMPIQKKELIVCHTYEDSLTPWVGQLLSSIQAEVEEGIGCEAVSTQNIRQNIEYGYDNLGRQIRATTTLENKHRMITEKSYDSSGRVETLTYPNNFKIKNEYSDSGHLRAVSNAKTGQIYQKIENVDAYGRITKESLLGGVVKKTGHDVQRGWINDIRIKSSSHGDIYHVSYTHYNNGSNRKRISKYFNNSAATGDVIKPILHVEEAFQFDNLDRLTNREVQIKSQLGDLGNLGIKNESYQYDGFGNITFKTGVGQYEYSNKNRPHRLSHINGNRQQSFAYDEAGNNIVKTGDNERTIKYTANHKPYLITTKAVETTLKYGVDNRRFYRKDVHINTSEGIYGFKETYYLGKIYEKVKTSGMKDKKGKQLPGLSWETYYVGNIAIKRFEDPDKKDVIRVMHGDAIGSTVAITDETGSTVSQSLYDPFGQRQDVIQSHSLIEQYHIDEDRHGFTGHEELEGTNLIHMNGRIYDPVIARFMQADPIVQFPSLVQGYNRYAYVQNNPLKFVDPSGFRFGFIGKIWKQLFHEYDTPMMFMAVAMTIMTAGATSYLIAANQVVAAYMVAAAGGYMTGRMASGTHKGGLTGAISAAAFLGAGQALKAAGASASMKVLTHGVMGGIISDIQGGKFSHGFISAGLTKGATVNGIIPTGLWQGTIVSALVGGAIAEMTGGKFANGAVTAAFAYAMSNVMQNHQGIYDSRKSKVLTSGPMNDKQKKLFGGKVILSEWGPNSEGASEADTATVETSLKTIFATNNGEKLYSHLSEQKPLNIILNNIGENYGLNNYSMTVDLSTKLSFYDLSKEAMPLQQVSTTRLLAHEMGHAVLGLPDDNNVNVQFTDEIMKSINGTQRGQYSNSCRVNPQGLCL